MDWLVGVLIAGLLVFSMASAIREIRLYRKAARGEIQYLISRSRRNRRLIVSGLLLAEAVLLFLGTFVLPLQQPGVALIFWTPSLLLMLLVVRLALMDFRETRRDIDRIYMESIRSAMKKVEQVRKN